MKRFIEGLDRSQATLLPDCTDDYVEEDNLVRAVDAFADMLDLAVLGFDVDQRICTRRAKRRRPKRASSSLIPA